jgi:transcription elongation factor GreA-like protein
LFPDLLEQQARDNPNEVIHALLNDLGPKTAAEIKDELCELVIPEKDWTKWWQWARTKLKKDPMVETPQSLKQPFRLRKAELTEKDMLQQALQDTVTPNEIILQCYNLVRDIPAVLKNPDVNKMLRQSMLSLLDSNSDDPSIALQVSIFFENTFNETLEGRSVASLVQKSTNIPELIDNIEILAYKTGPRRHPRTPSRLDSYFPRFLQYSNKRPLKGLHPQRTQ